MPSAASSAGPRLPGFKVSGKSGKLVTRRPITEQQLINAARRVLNARFARGAPLASPQLAGEYFHLLLADRPQETFVCLFLDGLNRVIGCEELFRGSAEHAVVCPRLVVRRALALNAVAVLFAHNHPAGGSAPSTADRQLTGHLQQALNLVGIRVLDHFVVGSGRAFSFAEHGLLGGGG